MTKLKLKILEIIKDPEIREALKKIVDYEEKRLEEYRTNPVYQGMENLEPWWEWQDVAVHWKIIHKLVLNEVVDVLGGRRKWYKLKNRELIKKALQEYNEYRKLQEEIHIKKTVEIPKDLFDVIEGYDDLKYYIKLSLTADEPVHILLVGPPGTAKTLFLMELERLEGSYFITAGTATKVGIRDIIYEELPRYLIIDEIDKIQDPKDLSALLTWMENGRIIITKHGFHDERRGKGWVFAACNVTRGLPPELLDRFQIFNIKPYTKEQFINVVTNYLRKRMDIKDELAEYIARKTSEYTLSVREAIRIARLCKTRDEVDKIINIIHKYR